MIKKFTLTLFLTLFALLAQTSAQTASAPEKEAAIKELIAVMNSQMKASDLIAAASAEADKTAAAITKRMIDEDVNLSTADKKTLEDLLLIERGGMLKRFQNKMMEKLDFDALIEEMMISSYSKHFTVEEIREMTAFYKSAIGQKLLKTTPLIFSDTMQTMTEKVYPKMMEVIKESEADMKREIEVRLKEQKSKIKSKAV